MSLGWKHKHYYILIVYVCLLCLVFVLIKLFLKIMLLQNLKILRFLDGLGPNQPTHWNRHCYWAWMHIAQSSLGSSRMGNKLLPGCTDLSSLYVACDLSMINSFSSDLDSHDIVCVISFKFLLPVCFLASYFTSGVPYRLILAQFDHCTSVGS